jgi:fermentation-respiration switch protein FrsA (DUF1100 family)
MIIPPSQGQQLFALANETKQFLFVPEAGHNDLFNSNFHCRPKPWDEGGCNLLRLVEKIGF